MARVKSVSPRKPITNPSMTVAINANSPRAAKRKTNRALAKTARIVKTVKTAKTAKAVKSVKSVKSAKPHTSTLTLGCMQ